MPAKADASIHRAFCVFRLNTTLVAKGLIISLISSNLASFEPLLTYLLNYKTVVRITT